MASSKKLLLLLPLLLSCVFLASLFGPPQATAQTASGYMGVLNSVDGDGLGTEITGAGGNGSITSNCPYCGKVDNSQTGPGIITERCGPGGCKLIWMKAPHDTRHKNGGNVGKTALATAVHSSPPLHATPTVSVHAPAVSIRTPTPEVHVR
jgi:hypothetical protein